MLAPPLLVAIVALGYPGLAAAAPAARVADTKFSHHRGLYTEPFTVLIRSSTPGARIRYTTDGRPPSEDTGAGGASPQSVEISTTTVLRAAAFADGMEPTNVDTQTYLFPRAILRQPPEIPGYPTPTMRSGPSSEVRLDYGMDPEIVNDPAYAAAALRGFRSLPSLSLALPREHMFGENGVYYATDGNGPTHPVSVEVIYPRALDESFQTECALESHATVAVKRSFKLKFKSEFGPGKLRSDFFARSPLNGDSATGEIDRIILRAGNERSFAIRGIPDRTTYARDQWVRDSQIAMSGYGSHGTFVHLFINGLYWGLYNAVERPDAWFASSYFGGPMERWFAVNHGGPFQGDPSRWNYLRHDLKDKDMRALENYEELATHLDPSGFADYLILAFYAGFADWPYNNWYGGNRNAPPTPFRFFVWDAELSWVHNRRPDGARRDPSHPWNIQAPFRSTEELRGPTMVGIWHSVRKNPDFMTLFADRVHAHLTGALSDASSIARFRALADFIADAVVLESARWGDAREELGEPVRTRDGTFLPEVDQVVGMMDGAAERFLDAMRREGYYPAIDPPTLHRTRAAWSVAVSFGEAKDDTSVYYTIDGGDPRAPGGGVAASARKAEPDGVVRLRASTTTKIRARRLAGEEWSALAETTVCSRNVVDSALEALGLVRPAEPDCRE